MKQDPIVYRQEYQFGGGSGFRAENGSWVYKREITLQASNWMSGVYARFEVFDFQSSMEKGNVPVKVLDVTIYDRDVKDEKTKLLMMNLASEDLRGRTAELTAWQVFWDLFLCSIHQVWVPEKDLGYFHKHAGLPIIREVDGGKGDKNG